MPTADGGNIGTCDNSVANAPKPVAQPISASTPKAAPPRAHTSTRFRIVSGLDVSSRFDLYRLAYLVFRLGFCKMGISTVVGSPEETRLKRAYEYYRAQAHRLLALAALKGQAA